MNGFVVTVQMRIFSKSSIANITFVWFLFSVLCSDMDSQFSTLCKARFTNMALNRFFTFVNGVDTFVLLMSVPQKSLPSAVVIQYWAW